jgi:FixJ family two-component response regulator
VRAFASGEAFLASDAIGAARCLILDLAMPGMRGTELQRELRRRGHDIPIIFITAHGDAADRPRLIRQGAADCLLKPFSETDLLRALSRALPVE